LGGGGGGSPERKMYILAGNDLLLGTFCAMHRSWSVVLEVDVKNSKSTKMLRLQTDSVK